ncbi:MAG: hypothetical protein ACE5FU_09910 [Nitrospinota bacterium]
MYKDEIDLRILVDTIIEQKLITPQQAEEVKALLKMIRTKGRKYLGEILVEKGYVPEKVIKQFVVAMQGYYEKFCKQMVDKGYLRRVHFEKILEEKKNAPNKDIAEIVIQNGFMGRDSFYKLFINFAKVPPLGQILVTKGHITKEQFEEARAAQKVNTFEELLIEKGYLTKEQLVQATRELERKKEQWYRERNNPYANIDRM